MIYLPILGAIGEGIGMTIEKILLKKSHINYKNYIVYGFLSIVLVMIPLIYFFWEIQPQAYALKNILIFAFIIVSSIIANLLIFYSLKRETLTNIEPTRLMQPIFTILLAVLIFSSERKLSIIVLSLIASIALVASHIKKHHIVFNKYIIAALLGSLFFAIELVTSRFILEFYNPFTFYFLRCLTIFLIALLIFRPKNHFKTKTKLLFLTAGAIWVFYRVILYWGYLALGIVFIACVVVAILLEG
jgi:drug/metabolite transporter (DMT)-like permease